MTNWGTPERRNDGDHGESSVQIRMSRGARPRVTSVVAVLKQREHLRGSLMVRGVSGSPPLRISVAARKVRLSTTWLVSVRRAAEMRRCASSRAPFDDKLVLADAVVGGRIDVADAAEEVVGVEHGVLGGAADALVAEHADVGVGLDHHGEVPPEGLDAPDALGRVVEAVEGGLFVLVLLLDDDGRGAGSRPVRR